MNKTNAKAFLPLVQALADGKVIEVFYAGSWCVSDEPLFDRPIGAYRIKEEKKWYRVGKTKYTLFVVMNAEMEADSACSEAFEGWITERIEYSPHQPKRYFRVALMKGKYAPYTSTCTCREDATSLEKSEEFVRWLTHWTPYDVA